MNAALALEIYHRNPWHVAPERVPGLLAFLNDLRNGVNHGGTGEKLNSFSIYDLKSATRVVSNDWQMSNSDAEAELVYVLNLNGVLTKNGGDSTYGTKDIAAQLLRFDADSRVKGGIMYVDTPGGSSVSIEPMEYAFSQKTKPVVTLVERGGQMYSAGYGVGALADYIMAENANCKVGCLGTMINFSGVPNGERDGNNAVNITLYATNSFDKNKAFEEAINNQNYELVINEKLNPADEIYLNRIKAARSTVTPDQMHGKEYNAGDVLGTMVDEIGPFENAVAKVLELSAAQGGGKTGGKPAPKSKNNTKHTVMTASEIQTQHPEAYSAIFGAGVAAEADRTGAWLAHAGTDMEAVTAGIKGGKAISQTESQELLVKASSMGILQKMQQSGASNVITPQSETLVAEEDGADDLEVKALYGRYNIKSLKDLN